MASDLIETSGPSSGELTTPSLDTASQAELTRALAMLKQRGGFVVRMADVMAGVMGRGLRAGASAIGSVPGMATMGQSVAEFALKRAFDIAILRLGTQGELDRSRRLASPMVVLSGAVGGFVGLGGFLPDATVTTLAIMREIARIAQEEGEDLRDPQTRASCLEVFGLTPAGADVREPEMSYFSARLMMQGRPLATLLAEVAPRFGLTLSQKFAAQAVPVMGAIGGATLNAAFLSHYRDIARAHFTIRRLERVFGEAAIRHSAAQHAPA